MPLLGLGSRARPTAVTAEPAQEGAAGPFPIHLHGAERVRRCSWDRSCRWPPQGAGTLQRRCFTRAKARAGGGKLFSKGWASVTSHGLGQWLFLFFFFFLTPKTKWQFIVGSLTECWKDLHEVNSKFIQVYGHSAIILIPRTRECFTLAAISFGTKISGTLGNTNP